MTTVFTFFTPGVLASIEFSRRRRLTLLNTSKRSEGDNTIVITQRQDHVLPLLQLREDHHGEDSRFRELSGRSVTRAS